MWFWILLAVQIGLSFVSALLATRNKNRPSALGDFTFPTAQEGRMIPVICGTVPLDGGNTVWWGDLLVKPIKQGNFGTFYLVSTTVGYKYYIGVQLALCQGPIDALIGIESDSKPVTYSASGTDPTVLTLNAPKLYGGDKAGGGLVGEINLYFGTNTQGSDPYLSLKQTAVPSLPSYSGTGNGYLAFVSAGTASVNETITILATNFDAGRGAMKFSVTGSVSGSLGHAWAGTAFGSTKINFTITPGSIQFIPGDVFHVVTSPSRVSPSYHGMCYAVFKRVYVGTSSYPKPVRFIVRRCPDPLGMGTTYARLNTKPDGSADANPAFFIYEWLTNPAWGLGVSATLIDTTSFTAAAATLKNEQLGISTIVDKETTGDAIITEILRHIDGTLYVEPTTGFWVLKLIRSDYDPTTVPVLTIDNVLDTPQFSRSQWAETINQIFVQYLDRGSDFQTRTVQNHDLANVTVTGEVRAQTLEFKMISNSAAAALVATRGLKPLAYPLSKLKVIVNRVAWNWRQGDLFKFTWVPLGINGLIFRIARIAYGQLTDAKITIDAVEDVFGIGAAAFEAPPDSGWVNPTGSPLAPIFERLLEVPYAKVSTTTGLTLGIWVYAFCSREDATPTDFQVWQDFGAGDTETNDLPNFCPAGYLSAAYLAATVATDPTGFTIAASGADLETPVSTDATGLANGANLALIDDEIIAWQTVTLNVDGTRTYSNAIRGVLDTAPADHQTGTAVFFFTSGAEQFSQASAYGADLLVKAKLLPTNNLGTLPIGSASQITLQTRSRYLRPYPPGNLQIAGNAYGTRPATNSGDLTFTWASRNRLTQTTGVVMIPQDHADITGESGQTFSVEIWINGALVRRVDAIAVETYTYTHAQYIIDDPGGTHPTTFKIFSHTGAAAPAGLDSYECQLFTLQMT